MTKHDVPRYFQLMNPVLQALRKLGGSASNSEIETEVAEILKLTDEQTSYLRDPDKHGQTLFSYRLAWAKTYLKKYGLLENSSRGVWALTPEGRKVNEIDEKEVSRAVKIQDRLERQQREEIEEYDLGDVEPLTWEDDLMSTLLAIDASAFERLIQRLLRESGFVQVEVTGRTGDGGIDGKGIMRLGGLLSFHVFFQCKKYKGSVGAGHVRDFRGAMTGRADKGLIITTGSFTKDATAEATRDGAPPIDLIDGDQLMELLRSLSLGVTTKIVEREEITINKEWFSGI